MLRKLAIFKKGKYVHIVFFCTTSDGNGNFKNGKTIMHDYRTSHGGDLDENDNFKLWKLIIHGYQNCTGAILTKMKIIKIDTQRYYLVDLLGWKH